MNSRILLAVSLILILLAGCSKSHESTLTIDLNDRKLTEAEYAKEIKSNLEFYDHVLNKVGNNILDMKGDEKDTDADSIRLAGVVESLKHITPPDKYSQQHGKLIEMFDKLSQACSAYAGYLHSGNSNERGLAAGFMSNTLSINQEIVDFMKEMSK